MNEDNTQQGPVALAEKETSTVPACVSCGREPGPGIACQFCGQLKSAAPGIRLSTAGKRLGAHLLDLLLSIVTLGIGWLVWTFVTYKDGQTPAKKLLRMRTINLRSAQPATWGGMFVREFLAKTIVSFFTLGIGCLWLLWDNNNQNLYDKMVGTVV